MHRPPAELQVRLQRLTQSDAARRIVAGPSVDQAKIPVDRQPGDGICRDVAYPFLKRELRRVNNATTGRPSGAITNF